MNYMSEFIVGFIVGALIARVIYLGVKGQLFRTLTGPEPRPGTRMPGTIYMRSHTNDEECKHNAAYGSIDILGDEHVIYKAYLYRDAARRLNKVLVIDMVPVWAAVLLRLAGVRTEPRMQ